MIVLRPSFERVLAGPTPDYLWDLQKALLGVGGADAERARAAVLFTAAVGAISVPELRDRQDRGLAELLESALPAVLEIGAAVQTAAAWEIEARLIYDEFAWFLYAELWDLSATHRPNMPVAERRSRVDDVLDPLLDPGLSDADRARLVADIFMSVLAARVLPMPS